jgi:hypothetical protein
MADLGIYTKNADIQARAGVNANTTSKATAATDVYVLNIESMINVRTRYNWSDAFTAGLNADVQGILTHTGACWCAMLVISSDMSGYTSRSEAQTMLDFLNNEVNKGIAFLKEKAVETFILGA